MAGGLARGAAVGRRRRPRVERARAAVDAEGRSRRRSDGGGAVMMRLPQFRYRAPRTIDDAVAWLAENPADTMLLAGGTDVLPNMKRRQQTPATLIGLRGIRELAQISERRRADASALAYRSPRSPSDARIRDVVPRTLAGGRAGGHAASAQHGNDRRQPVPRHALHVLRPDLRVAQGDRLLHEAETATRAGSPPRARSAWRCRRRIPRRCCRRSARRSTSLVARERASWPSQICTPMTACIT